MCYIPRFPRGVVVIWLGVAATCLAQSPASPAKSKPLPPFAEVQKAVSKYFAANQDYKSGDLITQDQVGPLLKQLQQQGLPLPDAAKILERVPAKGEFMVEQFSTPNGRKFMRRVATYPDGFDRVDRLSRMPRGRQLVQDLIKNPRGDQLIEYMTTTKAGKKLGKDLGADPGGTDFNAPTRRIYTAAQLSAQLKQSHTAAMNAAAKPNEKK